MQSDRLSTHDSAPAVSPQPSYAETEIRDSSARSYLSSSDEEFYIRLHRTDLEAQRFQPKIPRPPVETQNETRDGLSSTAAHSPGASEMLKESKDEVRVLFEPRSLHTCLSHSFSGSARPPE